MCASKYKACIVVNFCFLVWQQRSNIFAPPDGELTCVVCEADRAASLAEPPSKPLATICDDTLRCNHCHGPGTEEADKNGTSSETGFVSTNVSSLSEQYLQDGDRESFWRGICAR